MLRLVASLVVGVVVACGMRPDAAGAVRADIVTRERVVDEAARWEWPVAGAPVSRPYVAPATRYSAGHRGVDLATEVGAVVAAPVDAVVLFAGRVVDRGVLTLDVGGGVVVTVEPIATDLSPGDAVARGHPLGTVDVGGHAAHGELHLGVRVDGEYVDPMRFFGGTPRAILLPCC